MAKAITEALLTEYEKLEKQIKEMEERKNQIKEMCKERGSFETRAFMIEVKTNTQERIAGLSEVIKKIERKKLESLGLIKEVEYMSVKIQRKG